MTLISKSKPASQVTPTAVQFGWGGSPIAFWRTAANVSHLRGRVSVESGHDNDVIERATGRLQHGREIRRQAGPASRTPARDPSSRLPTWPETNRKEELRLRCLAIIGAGDAITRELARGRASDSAAAATLASLIAASLSDSK